MARKSEKSVATPNVNAENVADVVDVEDVVDVVDIEDVEDVEDENDDENDDDENDENDDDENDENDDDENDENDDDENDENDDDENKWKGHARTRRINSAFGVNIMAPWKRFSFKKGDKAASELLSVERSAELLRAYAACMLSAADAATAAASAGLVIDRKRAESVLPTARNYAVGAVRKVLSLELTRRDKANKPAGGARAAKSIEKRTAELKAQYQKMVTLGIPLSMTEDEFVAKMI